MYLRAIPGEQPQMRAKRLEHAATCPEEVLNCARKVATGWRCSNVELWNPSSIVKELVEMTELEYVEEERENTCIPSLRWHSGTNPEAGVVWENSEKYCSC
jgi:hypothetical protein